MNVWNYSYKIDVKNWKSLQKSKSLYSTLLSFINALKPIPGYVYLFSMFTMKEHKN